MVQRNVVTPPPPSINNDSAVFKGAVLKYLTGEKLHITVTGNGQFKEVIESACGESSVVSELGHITVLYDEDISQVFNEYVEGLRSAGMELLGYYGKLWSRKHG